jgi:acyl-CoA synthetase (AMP-forming)/AMP-acid ligase II/ABC-type branched-subunit amino acid transport system permease subunit
MKAATVPAGSLWHRVWQSAGYAAVAVLVGWIAVTQPYSALVNFASVTAYAVALLGLNLVIGYSGQLSLGHSAFFGIGAYTAAILYSDYSWPFLATLPAAAAIGAGLGLLLGLPALRVRGLYLALITLALVLAFPSIANMQQLKDLTGGPNGKIVYVEWPAPDWLPVRMSDPAWQFLTLAAIAALLFFLASNMVRSRVGRALLALRDNETGAAVSGVNLAAWKTGAFAVSAGFAAIGGAMLTLVVPIVGPDSGGFFVALALITGLVLGGASTISGAVIGALAIVWLPSLSRDWASGIPFLSDEDGPMLANVLYGAILIGVIFLMPGGVVSFVRRLRSRFVRFVPDLPAADSPPEPTTVPLFPTTSPNDSDTDDSDQQVTTMDFPSLLRKSCRMHRDNRVATFEGHHQTYGQLWERSCRLANALHSLGVQPGDRVALLGDNRLESVELVTGLALGNFVRVMLYTQNTASVQAYALDLVGATACIVDEKYAGDVLAIAGQVSSLKHVVVIGTPSLGSGAHSYEEMLANTTPTDPQVPVKPSDDHVIRFSAGTTGKPKGILFTTAGWISHCQNNQLYGAAMDEDSAFIAAAPMSHASGLPLWQVIMKGARFVIMSAFDPTRYLETIERERCTHTLLVPTMIQMVAAVPNAKDYDLSSIKAVLYGAAPITEKALRAGLDLWGNIMYQLYGQSECLDGAVLLPRYHRPDGDEREQRWLRSAGRPAPGSIITIRDDDGHELPTGEVGEICMKTPAHMKGIYGDPVATAARFTADGAVRTRDMGYLDDDYFLYIVDRKEDMIISGGFNIWPLEIENALSAHPDVQEVAVVGVPDEKWGEAVLAAVVLTEGSTVTEEELIAWAREKVGPVKKPKRIVVASQPLPKSPVGKLLRRQVREVYGPLA